MIYRECYVQRFDDYDGFIRSLCLSFNDCRGILRCLVCDHYVGEKGRFRCDEISVQSYRKNPFNKTLSSLRRLCLSNNGISFDSRVGLDGVHRDLWQLL